ncbi:hypothetical protein QBC34DRAFT_284485, partial [Podospora aff. communis PSN243]
KTKSKMGCRTCRARRVKCDEGKPACQRCISTGRVCDGYGIWGGGGNSYGSAERAVNTLFKQSSRKAPSASKTLKTTSPALIPGLDQQEYATFDFFRRRTATKLPGMFSSEFWDTLVFQLSSREPAVLHAVIALAATHRRAIAVGHARRPFLATDEKDVGLDSDEVLALQQFNKAVGHLQRFKRKTQESLRATLVSCIIFICIELLKGKVGPSQAHFQSGLKLLQEIQPGESDASPMQPHAKSVDNHVAEAFARLNIQSSISGGGPDQSCMMILHKLSELEPEAPLVFDSISSARRHLDRLVQQVHRLSAEAKQAALNCQVVPSRLVLDQERLQRSVTSWLRTFTSSLPRMETFEPEGSHRITLGAPLLLLYHAMISIMVATSLRCGDETIYDSHTASFATILEQATNLWNKIVDYVPVTPRPGQPDHLSFTVDLGFIPPLYFTALRCRVPRFRRLAIGLLASTPHREGVWDGAVTAAIARKIVEMEEGGFYSGAGIKFAQPFSFSHTGIPPSLPPDDVPRVPRANRINYVSVELPEPGTGDKVILVCKR